MYDQDIYSDTVCTAKYDIIMSAKNGSDCKGYLRHGLLTEGKTLVYHWCHACNI